MADDTNIERPQDRIKIMVGEVERELFMSFQRLNNCLALLSDPDNLPSLMIDPFLGDAILRTMVAETPSTPVDTVEVAEGAISMDDYDKVLLWVRDHLSHFFLKRFQQLGEQAKKLEPAAERLVSSLTGSQASSSSAPSAGPSA